MIAVLLLAHVVAAVVALVGGARLGRRAWPIVAVAPASVLGWLVLRRADIADGGVSSQLDWVPQLGLRADLRVDAFSALMLILVSGVGLLVVAYAWSYFGRAPSAGRIAGLLTLFAGSMFGVVVADNLLVLYVFWELTSVTSYLLIGIDDEDAGARAAAQHALLVTGMGGLVMLAGFVLLGHEAGTYSLSELLAAPPTGTTTGVALVLVLVGALTKSAQFPFHAWLPGAMVAPTPISAYLHSAAMVKAGVYLVARLAPAFAAVGPWRPIVVGAGLCTMLLGGLRALRPFDLKQILAFSTISQLGFLVVLFGIGTPEATVAGCAVLLAHGLCKAALFMVVGIVDHGVGTRDVRLLPVLGPEWTATKVVAVLSAGSMAAVPPLAGFLAKEQAYAALVEGSAGDRAVLAGIVVGSMLTVAYSLRLVTALVRPQLLADHAPDGAGAHPHAPGRAFAAPAVVLAGASLLLGVVPWVWSGLIDGASHALDHEAHAHLVLWHGFTAALGLSVVTLVVGAGLFLLRGPVARVQARVRIPGSALGVYEASVRGLLTAAARVTAIVQSGSLPIYTAIIFATAAVAPLTAMALGTWWPGWPELVGAPAHVPLAAVLIAGAVATTIATRRFAAALLLGIVGYGMAMVFVVQGAPDLALTQFAIETLSVVVFLLVFRALPDRFERRALAVGGIPRLATSLAVGLLVVVVAVATTGAQTAPPVSAEMSELALPEGHGKNVVNVILVDIRGLDTLGEITVLAVAGIGIVALARAGRRPRSETAAHRRHRATGGRSL